MNAINYVDNLVKEITNLDEENKNWSLIHNQDLVELGELRKQLNEANTEISSLRDTISRWELAYTAAVHRAVRAHDDRTKLVELKKALRTLSE